MPRRSVTRSRYYIAVYGGKHKHLLIAALVIPFFVNYLVRTYAWVALLSDDGLVNSVAKDLGLTDTGFRMLNTSWSVIGGLVYGYLVFMILPLYASIERTRSVGDRGGQGSLSARRSGPSSTSRCPRPSRASWPAACSSSCPPSGDFVAAQLLGGPNTYMIGNLIQDQFFAGDNWPFGAAMTVIMMVFLAFFMIWYLRSLRT